MNWKGCVKKQSWSNQDIVSVFGFRYLSAFILKRKSVFLLQLEVQPVGKGGMGICLPNTWNTISNFVQHTDEVRYFVVFVQTHVS